MSPWGADYMPEGKSLKSRYTPAPMDVPEYVFFGRVCHITVLRDALGASASHRLQQDIGAILSNPMGLFTAQGNVVLALMILGKAKLCLADSYSDTVVNMIKKYLNMAAQTVGRDGTLPISYAHILTTLEWENFVIQVKATNAGTIIDLSEARWWDKHFPGLIEFKPQTQQTRGYLPQEYSKPIDLN